LNADADSSKIANEKSVPHGPTSSNTQPSSSSIFGTTQKKAEPNPQKSPTKPTTTSAKQARHGKGEKRTNKNESKQKKNNRQTQKKQKKKTQKSSSASKNCDSVVWVNKIYFVKNL
jgi:hypothetical protein